MTLVNAIKCHYNNKECVLLLADKAVSFGNRKYEADKLIKIEGLPIVIGASGYESEIQKSIRILTNEFRKIESNERLNLVDVVEDILFSKEIKEYFEEELSEDRGCELIIGVTCNNSSNFYVFSSSGNVVKGERQIHSIGCGFEYAYLFFFNSVALPFLIDENIDLNYAVRLLGFINLVVSNIDKNVSSNFECMALCDGRIGKINKVSKIKLIKEINNIDEIWRNHIHLFIHKKEHSSILNYLKNINVSQFKKIFKPKENKKMKAFMIAQPFDRNSQIFKTIEEELKKNKLELFHLESMKDLKKIKDKNDIGLFILNRRIKKRLSLDVLDEIKKFFPNIPILLLSRGTQDKDLKEFINRGISLHVAEEEIENNPEKFETIIKGLFYDGEYIWEWE